MVTVDRWRRALLTGGILASVLYVAMTLVVGLLWEGYSVASNVPSELSAIGAPTRTLWILACGAVAGTYASDLQADLPTPWAGAWERISIATFIACIVVLAITLLRGPRGTAP